MNKQVARHRTAIKRHELSRPLRVALKDGLVSQERSVFDYGCGQGDDLRHLESMGISSLGWDPAFRTVPGPTEADVVNLGYGVNVIEDQAERASALRRAWSLSRKVLVVAARLSEEVDTGGFADYQDGYLTRLGTFQKLYDQQELRSWIEEVLETGAVAAAPGVFYVFRSAEDREHFVLSRYRRKTVAPRQRISDLLFEQHRMLLNPLIEFVTNRGRLPDVQELPAASDLIAKFGSIKRAFAIIRRVTAVESWDEITRSHTQDLIVYLALGRFPRRLRFGILPRDLQRDVKAFFGTYRRACDQADSLLFSAGDMGQIDAACQAALIGKLMPNALYVHVTGLDQLPPVLRVFEGCARVLAGTVEAATILKLHRREPKVSYLCYPDFDAHAHPELQSSLRVHLQTLRIQHQDFQESDNPPILHRKEELVPASYPLRADFAELTRAEEACGLFADPNRIGNKKYWEEVLERNHVRINGHRVVKDEYIPPV
jgi:DNA phosphorothioation-associated putative methyltransferase